MRRTLMLAGAFAAALAAAQQFPYSAVSLGVRVDGYNGVVYAARPAGDAPFLFYPGERIRLKADLVNGASAPQAIRWNGSGGRQLFDARVMKDGVPSAVRVAFNHAVYRSDDETHKAVRLGSNLTLSPGGRAVFDGEVLAGAAPPGVYMLELVSDATDAAGRPLAPQSTRLRFELRAETAGERAETIRRKALDAIADGHLRDAARLATELLAADADSFAAYVIRGQVAEAQGRSSDAVTAYRRALDILENDRDHRYSAPAGSLDRDGQIEGLRGTIRRLSNQR